MGLEILIIERLIILIYDKIGVENMIVINKDNKL
jgi:hypothetical protein